MTDVLPLLEKNFVRLQDFLNGIIMSQNLSKEIAIACFSFSFGVSVTFLYFWGWKKAFESQLTNESTKGSSNSLSNLHKENQLNKTLKDLQEKCRREKTQLLLLQEKIASARQYLEIVEENGGRFPTLNPSDSTNGEVSSLENNSSHDIPPPPPLPSGEAVSSPSLPSVSIPPPLYDDNTLEDWEKELATFAAVQKAKGFGSILREKRDKLKKQDDPPTVRRQKKKESNGASSSWFSIRTAIETRRNNLKEGQTFEEEEEEEEEEEWNK